MKSVIEEASSLEKAVERGWLKAGKPQEFSVKIFQEPTKNFLGMTKQMAKICLFFHDRPQPQGNEKNNKPTNKDQQSRTSFGHRGSRPGGFKPRRPHSARPAQDGNAEVQIANDSGNNQQKQHNKPRFQRHQQRPRPQQTTASSTEQNPSTQANSTKREPTEN